MNEGMRNVQKRDFIWAVQLGSSALSLPNFLVIGDIKAGSTSLYHYLKQHPEIYMPEKMKELRFFSFDETSAYHRKAGSTRIRSEEEYEKWFEDAGTAKAIGEASPNYLRSPVAAENILRCIGAVKLIACIRNPADRLYSLYQMIHRTDARPISFEEKVFSENATWVKGNFLWPELQRFFDHFPREQIKVVLFDDLVQDPNTVLSELFRFLGVGYGFRPELGTKNRGGLARNPRLYGQLVSLKSIVKKIAEPPQFAKASWAKFRSSSLHKPRLDPGLRQAVLRICREDVLRTQALLNRDLSKWLPDDVE